MKTQDLSLLTINKLSQEQYNRELEAGNISEDELYLTPYEEQITDSELSSDSQNPIQNQAVTKWLEENVKSYNLEVSGEAVYLGENIVSTHDDQIETLETDSGDYNIKYIELKNGGRAFFKSGWENIYNKPSTYTPSPHSHSLSEIEDFKVDSELSASSENPLANKIITENINSLKSKIDTIYNYEFITTADIDAICGTTIQNTLVEEVLF